jgi:hypothetical protein
MQEPVSDGCLVDITRLGVGDIESMVGAMSIRFVFQVLMKIENVVHEMQLKLLDVFLIPFAFHKLFPGFK